jgi:hypothetical protein
MTFDLADAARILAATPSVLRALLQDLPPDWVSRNEGPATWSPYDVVGHLIHGERTDWMPRARLILSAGDSVAFEPFDREAQFRESRGRPLDELLTEFAALRAANLQQLEAMHLSAADLDARGRHPALGPVTLRQLLATWVAHDCDHIMQVARVIGSQYADEVGPWRAYLRVISGTQG